MLMHIFLAVHTVKTSEASVVKAFLLKMLKDVGMVMPKSVETRKRPCSKTGDEGMQQ